jgi:hypothetical protein
VGVGGVVIFAHAAMTITTSNAARRAGGVLVVVVQGPIPAGLPQRVW